jgi:hypothetical protein
MSDSRCVGLRALATGSLGAQLSPMRIASRPLAFAGRAPPDEEVRRVVGSMPPPPPLPPHMHSALGPAPRSPPLGFGELLYPHSHTPHATPVATCGLLQSSDKRSPRAMTEGQAGAAGGAACTQVSTGGAAGAALAGQHMESKQVMQTRRSIDTLGEGGGGGGGGGGAGEGMQSVSNRRQQGHHICISHRHLTEASHIGISHRHLTHVSRLTHASNMHCPSSLSLLTAPAHCPSSLPLLT